jgi:hypothetical protein
MRLILAAQDHGVKAAAAGRRPSAARGPVQAGFRARVVVFAAGFAAVFEAADLLPAGLLSVALVAFDAVEEAFAVPDFAPPVLPDFAEVDLVAVVFEAVDFAAVDRVPEVVFEAAVPVPDDRVPEDFRAGFAGFSP